MLDGLSTVARPGRVLAVVGESGCGKSTLVALTERFYDPSGGSVQVDGVDIRQLNINWLRDQIGLVNQVGVLAWRAPLLRIFQLLVALFSRIFQQASWLSSCFPAACNFLCCEAVACACAEWIGTILQLSKVSGPVSQPCSSLPPFLDRPQEPDLFRTTVRNNIAYGARKFTDAPVTQEMIENAAKLSNAHDFIMALPQGRH